MKYRKLRYFNLLYSRQYFLAIFYPNFEDKQLLCRCLYFRYLDVERITKIKVYLFRNYLMLKFGDRNSKNLNLEAFFLFKVIKSDLNRKIINNNRKIYKLLQQNFLSRRNSRSWMVQLSIIEEISKFEEKIEHWF